MMLAWLLRTAPLVAIAAGVLVWIGVFDKADVGPVPIVTSTVLMTIAGATCVIATMATSGRRELRWWRLFAGAIGTVACALVLAAIVFVLALMDTDMPY
jgi:hypothetical protein